MLQVLQCKCLIYEVYWKRKEEWWMLFGLGECFCSVLSTLVCLLALSVTALICPRFAAYQSSQTYVTCTSAFVVVNNKKSDFKSFLAPFSNCFHKMRCRSSLHKYDTFILHVYHAFILYHTGTIILPILQIFLIHTCMRVWKVMPLSPNQNWNKFIQFILLPSMYFS